MDINDFQFKVQQVLEEIERMQTISRFYLIFGCVLSLSVRTAVPVAIVCTITINILHREWFVVLYFIPDHQ